jgi:hypothetical protein
MWDMTRTGRPPKPSEDKQPLPPKLGIYWESAELKDAVERFIMAAQMENRLPRTQPNGRRWWVTQFLMEAAKEKMERDSDGKTKK